MFETFFRNSHKDCVLWPQNNIFESEECLKSLNKCVPLYTEKYFWDLVDVPNVWWVNNMDAPLSKHFSLNRYVLVLLPCGATFQNCTCFFNQGLLIYYAANSIYLYILKENPAYIYICIYAGFYIYIYIYIYIPLPWLPIQDLD